MRRIDRKFHITDDGEIADSNGKIIPKDEPLFLLRGRDALAIAALRNYERLGTNGLIASDTLDRRFMHKRAGPAHQEAMYLIIADFLRWQRLHLDEVKVPWGSEHDDYSRVPMPTVAEG